MRFPLILVFLGEREPSLFRKSSRVAHWLRPSISESAGDAQQASRAERVALGDRTER